jgi:hypothetical protein
MALRVTLDTNTLPLSSWLPAYADGAFDFAVVSVTTEETHGTSFAVHLSPLEQVEKHTAYGAGPYGDGPYGGLVDRDCLRRALAIITNGGWSNPDIDEGLTQGQLNQRRDAEILCVHTREARDILVTNDISAFIRHGRREQIEATFGTRVLTTAEFVAEFSALQLPNIA